MQTGIKPGEPAFGVGRSRILRGGLFARSRNVSVLLFAFGAVALTVGCRVVQFRVDPYLQNPAPDAMTILWFSDDGTPGAVTVTGPDRTQTVASTPLLAKALCYHPDEIALLHGGTDPGLPYRHRVRITGLQPGTQYAYTVRQGRSDYTAHFRTAPAPDTPIRFIVYADCETEPESTGEARRWPEPHGDRERRYPVDQTVGYAENVKVMKSRRPDFIAIAGDLVESGGEQRDWDEFWRHNAGQLNDIASTTPILPAVGNHENYGGPDERERFSTSAVRQALAKFRTYFEAPDNGAPVRAQQGRYYRIDYGPITLITIDSSNGLPHQSHRDTNFYLLGAGELDDHGHEGEAPDFNPGSQQYRWLERQLADAQVKSHFTFVQFHHAPYSVGPHGFPPGSAGNHHGEDNQSGVPLRVLTPLFMRYGVDAVFSGHCEMYEHSLLLGQEELPDGTMGEHEIHFYDIGIGGDGLRGPSRGEDGEQDFPGNEYQIFLAHLDAPERWDGQRLIAGGKHYGHLEVNVAVGDDGLWKAELLPVYVFPRMDHAGNVSGWERRVYEDVAVLSRSSPRPATPTADRSASRRER
jgi:3',5'-cyclic AMP phosphodiesterase CpdA